MKTITKDQTKTHELEILEKDLINSLHQAGFRRLALSLNCRLLDETLLIIVEHSADVSLKTEPTLAALQEAILELNPTFAKQVGLCLKVSTAQQPYGFHSFTIAPVHSTNLTPTFSPENTEKISPDHSIENDFLTIKNVTPSLLDEPLESEDSEPEFLPQIPLNLSDNPFQINDLGSVKNSTQKASPSPSWKLILAASAGVAGVLFFGLLYMLNRPCVIGKCIPIPMAKQWVKDADQGIKKAQSVTGVIEAQKSLKDAMMILEKIPFWSPYYPEVQKLLADYRLRNINLELAISAMNKATLAIQKSNNPPHSVKTWREIKSLWESVIPNLENISKESQVYPLAQRKIKEYQLLLTNLNNYLQLEIKSEQALNEAKKSAEIAESREGFALFPDSWIQVSETWEKAVKLLKSVSSGTTSYEQARMLLPQYETKLTRSLDRTNTEKFGQETYAKALSSAAQGQIFGQRQEWSQALDSWYKAVGYIEQVPKTSSFYLKAQPLIKTYKESLTKVEEQVEISGRLGTARQDLQRICQGSIKVCDYTVSQELMTVQITPVYVQKLQQSLQNQALKNDKKQQEAVEKHLQVLQKALEAISNNAKVKLQVYDPEGKRIGSYVPKG